MDSQVGPENQQKWMKNIWLFILEMFLLIFNVEKFFLIFGSLLLFLNKKRMF